MKRLVIMFLIVASVGMPKTAPVSPPPDSTPPVISEIDKGKLREALKDEQIVTMQQTIADLQIQRWLDGSITIQDPSQIAQFPAIRQRQKDSVSEAKKMVASIESDLYREYKVDPRKFTLDENSVAFVAVAKSQKGK